MVSHHCLFVAFLASFSPRVHVFATLVNQTMEDFSPLVQYNCTKTLQRCDAVAAIKNTNPCRLPGAEGADRTFAYTHEPCAITIPFAGTAVYAFIACEPCQFEVDNFGAQDSIPGSQNSGVVGLSYFYNALPSGTHTLVITSPNDMLLDYVLYTIDDDANVPPPSSSNANSDSHSSTSSLPIGAATMVGGIFSPTTTSSVPPPASSAHTGSPSSTSSNTTLTRVAAPPSGRTSGSTVVVATTSDPSTSPSTSAMPAAAIISGAKTHLPIGTIAGGILGALVLGTAFSAIVVIFLKRRAAVVTQRKKIDRVSAWRYPANGSDLSITSDVEVGSAGLGQYNNSNSTSRAQLLNTRQALGTDSGSLGARVATRKREQMIPVVRDHGHAVRVGDSGLTPGGWADQLPPEYVEN
ncbi:hypothetical protein B0H19DRAFT_1253238 [Mycena capillaripes]|nr:hypothetical protein B0H19DRAFT_1253238 [Mycena capillaripes]